ncbi:hypothetical protein [Oceanicella sp. SM1341]|uniref:hypothetical protein n=1 Tax=Oceanicella sp. SM1341 TaxID=1548889 RepID=UPI000E47887E|nr:hypothetical protein [Oceanicella sp. SM1341]
MRPQRPNSYTEMISDALDVAGRKLACAELGKSPSTLSRWTDPDTETGRRMSVKDLDHLARTSPTAAAVLSRHFAALAGGFFMPGVAGEGDISQAAGAVMMRVGETQVALLEALGPRSSLRGDLTREEAQHMRPLVVEDIDACAALLALIDERLRPQVIRGGAA